LSLCTASLGLLGFVSESHAVNINTSGTACKGYGSHNSTDFVIFSDGIRNATTTPRYVICPVIRSPLSGTAGGGFYVSGANNTGQSTNCTLYSWEYNGTFRGAKSFQSSAPRYDQYLSFTNVELSFGAFTSLMCYMPPNSAGVLRGAAAYQ
jgi:hypothetical protein